METREKRGPARNGERRRPQTTVKPGTVGRPAPARGRTPVRPAPPKEEPARRQEHKPLQKPVKPSIIYTEPKAFDGKRVMLQLGSVAAVVLAVLFGVSIFFKVDMDKATVAGNEKYSVNDILDASGLRDGSNLLTLSDAQLSGSIKARLPYVSSVRIGIKLPDTVHIEIEELKVPYAIEDQDGSWWLMGADGKIVDTVTASASRTYTRVMGVKISVPEIGQMASAGTDPAPTVPAETTEETTEETTAPEQSEPEGTQPSATEPALPHPPVIGNRELLQTSLEILKHLEANGILGQAASVDVSNMGAIELWYGHRYQVNLGTPENLGYKISLLKATIQQMGEHQSGQLDISFTTWPNQVGYTPFA